MLKLKEGFVLQEVAGENVVLPSGDELDLNMMITLNSTGAFLWRLLEQGAEEESLVEALLKEYDVDEALARICVADYIVKLRGYGFLAE